MASCLEDDFEEEMISKSKKNDSMPCAVVQGYLDIMTRSRRSFAKINDYHLTIDRYHPQQFKIMFRMSRSAFSILLEEIKENTIFLSKTRNNGGKLLF